MEMKMTYIAIRTTDAERMKDFYVRYLGAVVEEACQLPMTEYSLSFKGGTKIKLISEEQLTGTGFYSMPVRPPCTVRLTFSVGSRRRVNELTCQLMLEGHEVISEPCFYGVKCYGSSIFDPEGNIIELVA